MSAGPLLAGGRSRTTARYLVPFAVLCTAAAAPDAPDTNDLESLLDESVVTTASRSAERASIAPSTVFNVTAAEMMNSGMRSVDEALEFLGLGIYVSKPRDFTTGIDVGAQGLLFRDAGRHVLVMLDGVILNSQGTGRISIHEALGVPLDLIDHIEVMLGPGSVIYGSNAMLAVINVITRRARDLPLLHTSVDLGTAAPQNNDGGIISANGLSTRLGLRYRLSAGGGGKFALGRAQAEVTAMVEWTQEESASYGVTPFSTGAAANQSFLPGQAQWGGSASHSLRTPSGVVTVQIGDFRLLVNAFGYSRGMPLVGTFNDPSAEETQTGVRLDLSHSRHISDRFTLDSRIYGGYHRFAERSNYGEDFWCIAGQHGCREEISARSAWLGLEQKLAIDWLQGGKVVTTVGYDVRPRFFDSTPANYTDLATGALPTIIALPHADSTSLIGAFFVQQVYRPRPWLALNAGARLDIDSTAGMRVSPRAAVVFTPGRSTTLRVSYNEAFRAPSQYELTEFDPTYRITPVGLRPETVRSLEVEAQQRVWRLNLSLRAYGALYEDLIESEIADPSEVAPFLPRLSPTVDPTVVVVNDNITSLQVVGGSASAQLRLPLGFSAAATFNLSAARLPDGTPYDRIPRRYGNFRVGWQSSESGYSISLAGVYTACNTVVLLNATPTDFVLGPRLDLRLAAAGPLFPDRVAHSAAGSARLRGLRWRAALGLAVNPSLPYVITTGTDTPSGYVLYPAAQRLFGFVGLQYDYTTP